MLHTVNKSPFQNTALESCLRFTQSGDCILLLEDGVYGAVSGTAQSALVEGALAKKVKVYALGADMKARALKETIKGVEITDYAGFVDLVAANRVHSWL
ncbi:MAG: sulfurtransferase complex subunit TusB [Magnetococcales bacterium]|nr:sulfurtransferase complex subunit TusB [Magnetococcales bacterium]MBF0150650.1 sulfurtransferase complex subunit TusB [Magnetococcales bacterium]MBF0173560.1 sulfurtransferase complex subunit TusB [Magnetococcales bacterium]MBF0349329.1 sulfurtransferase complex subunit TusB [Magnetococcales bacterium]MBF0630466.1 sulfurtransferase complex subunit TusB [Magnetococcales bacterium]